MSDNFDTVYVTTTNAGPKEVLDVGFALKEGTEDVCFLVIFAEEENLTFDLSDDKNMNLLVHTLIHMSLGEPDAELLSNMYRLLRSKHVSSGRAASLLSKAKGAMKESEVDDS